MLTRLTIDKTAGRYDPGIFKAVFLSGGPGSGKSTIIKLLRPEIFGLKLVNVDQVFELLMNKAGLRLKMNQLTPEDVARKDLLRDVAWVKLQTQLDRYIDARLGLCIDGTGRVYNDVAQTVKQLRDIGYECRMLFINTSLEVALERNQTRERSLPDTQVEYFWRQVQENMGKFQSLFGAANFTIIDNTTLVDADAVTPIWRELRKFVNAPHKAPQALDWIAREEQLRKRSRE